MTCHAYISLGGKIFVIGSENCATSAVDHVFCDRPARSDETSHLISVVLDHELYLKAGI